MGAARRPGVLALRRSRASGSSPCSSLTRTRSCSGCASAWALALLASALILAGRFLVPQETKVEDRPMYGDREAVEQVAEQARAGSTGSPAAG